MFKLIRQNLAWKIATLSSAVILTLALSILVAFTFISMNAVSKINLFHLFLLFTLLLTSFSVLIIHIFVISFIQKPLDKIEFALQQAQAGNLEINIENVSSDEMGVLALQFNEMFKKLSEVEAKKMQTERALVKAQEELKYQRLIKDNVETIQKTNEQLERSLQDLSVLYQVSQMISSTLEASELYYILIEAVVKKLGFMEFALLLLNEDKQKLEVALGYGFTDHEKIKGLSFSLGEGITGKAALEKQAIYIKDTSKEPLYLHYKGVKMEEGSFLSLPIISHHKVLAVMNFSRPGIDSFSNQDIRLLSSLASQVAVALENTKLYSKMKELSVTDDLTHVYNRRYFHQVLLMELKRAKRFERCLSLLIIDVDHFKKFNDNYGHLNGDKVLQQIAQLLSDHVREIDTVARFGGEEFAIILLHNNHLEAGRVAEKLCKLIAEHPIHCGMDGKREKVTVSIGVATYPENSMQLEDLISHADQALYQAKKEGRNRAVNYSKRSPELKLLNGQD